MAHGKNLCTWLEALLAERYGLKLTVILTNGQWCLSSPHHNGEIEMSCCEVFYQLGKPCFSVSSWDANAQGWQSVLGKPLVLLGEQSHSPLIELGRTGAMIHYDLLGLVYWCLSRSEEVGRTDLDSHERFPAKHSHAYKHGYLERPIVDEWLRILGQVIQKVWPNLELKQHQFSVKVSHDVDAPSQFGFVDLRRFIRRCGASLLLDKNIINTLTAPWVRLRTKDKLLSVDAYNAFDWLMSLSEKYQLTSAFYFICGTTDQRRDADYTLDCPAIRHLMCEIAERGHEIGLHPSYNTFDHAERISREADTLRRVCREEGIASEHIGGRMHYLRWQHPYTMQAWNDADLTYDSTMTYADNVGFRCGTCFEYPAINPVNQKMLDLRIRPLIAMECTVMDKAYMGLGVSEQAKQKFLQLAASCREVGGCFTMLWHNSEFSDHNKKRLYQSILESLHQTEFMQ